MFDGPEPIYVQIAQMIRAQVLAGELKEEEQVMSTTQFATTFRINPATAQKAFAGLVDEGVLYKRRGLGMFVAPGARERLLEEHRKSYFEDVLGPALQQAEILGISTDDVVAYVLGAGGSRTTTEES
ncbi:GntR family transcriptional regulator [Promicromonospora thailandica]|uniref:DNA-binding transcriptional regulator YhcF, GntR family n=1 Tax=Promicromonospora thailandica TaxID=765201 RepID=A0A9X2G3F9_9MICO|nr:GntR family transcriptional regulator [Promicromonospora thailandica]MCP2266380.1 DNA-binding transcriptional regulator YhcF, GntR family [Promicromonospora thailandica]BFF20058.1 GntR family transcriptional regulator [Promicromonospora thailandica]